MIIVVGSINLDLIARVERLPAPGETVPGSEFESAPGGKGANQALAAARAGAQVAMVGAVGRDAFAGEAIALLEAGGVDLAAVARVGKPTGIALIFVGGDAENMIAVVPGANGEVLPERLGQVTLSAGHHVLLQNEIPLDTVSAALRAARQAGAVSLYNPAPFVELAAPMLSEADVTVVNETEFDLYAGALGLPGGGRRERMEAFVAATGRIVVVTLGAEGVVAATPDGYSAIPALRITPVDTVGAGDTFCGYLAAALDAGAALPEALRRASVAGALACLAPGAQPSIPLAADVEARL